MRTSVTFFMLLTSVSLSARESVDIFTPATGSAGQVSRFDRTTLGDGGDFVCKGWLSFSSKWLFMFDFSGTPLLVESNEQIKGTNFKVVVRDGKPFLVDITSISRSVPLVVGGVYAAQ